MVRNYSVTRCFPVIGTGVSWLRTVSISTFTRLLRSLSFLTIKVTDRDLLGFLSQVTQYRWSFSLWTETNLPNPYWVGPGTSRYSEQVLYPSFVWDPPPLSCPFLCLWTFPHRDCLLNLWCVVSTLLHPWFCSGDGLTCTNTCWLTSTRTCTFIQSQWRLHCYSTGPGQVSGDGFRRWGVGVRVIWPREMKKCRELWLYNITNEEMTK